MRTFGSTAVTFIIVLAISAPLFSQAHPSLAGTWTLDRDKTAARIGASAGGARSGGTMSAGAPAGAMTAVGGGGVGAAPPETVITQTAAEITIERQLSGGPQKLVYKLNGSESVSVNARTTLKTKSRWEGNALITEGTQSTTSDQGPIAGTFKEVRSLDKDDSMIVETTRQVEGAEPSHQIQVLTRKK